MTGLVVELEQDVIGAVLSAAAVDRDAGWRVLDRAAAIVQPRHFYRPSLGALFAVLLEMRARELPVDALAVAVELEALTVERLEGLSGLVGAIVDARWILGTLQALAIVAPPFGTVEHRSRLVVDAWCDRTEPPEPAP